MTCFAFHDFMGRWLNGYALGGRRRMLRIITTSPTPSKNKSIPPTTTQDPSRFRATNRLLLLEHEELMVVQKALHDIKLLE